MKWDYASVVVWGIDETGPDGVDIYTREVAEIAQQLGAEIEPMTPLNGYQEGYQLTRKGELLLQCLTGGTGSACGSSQFIAASTASECYPLLQSRYPRHGVSRLDAAEDYKGEGVYEKLEAMLTRVCGERNVAMSPYGEGHIRPDGTRDSTKGRSWYCGSKASPFRIILYEKGLQQIAKGIPADPTWTRLEVRIMPSSKNKGKVGQLRLQPADLFSMSRWGMDVASALGIEDIERIQIGSIWRPDEQEQMALKIVRMFDRGMDTLLEQAGSPEAVGRLLYETQIKARNAKSILEMRKPSKVEA